MGLVTSAFDERPILASDGTHMVAMYSAEQRVLDAVLPFFVEGLQKKDRCFYAAAPATIADVKARLARANVDVDKVLKEGQLVLLDQKAPLLREGTFDPRYLVELYRADIKAAFDAGWEHVRATADMSWLLDGTPGRKNILYYEALSCELFNDTTAVHALCQYNTARMSGEEIIELLKIHPWALMDGKLGENPFWTDPSPETYRA